MNRVWYWDEVLKPRLEQNEREDAKEKLKGLFRIDPRDMSVIHYWDVATASVATWSNYFRSTPALGRSAPRSSPRPHRKRLASLEMALPGARFPAVASFSRPEAEDESFLPGRLGWAKDELHAGSTLPRHGHPEEL